MLQRSVLADCDLQLRIEFELVQVGVDSFADYGSVPPPNQYHKNGMVPDDADESLLGVGLAFPRMYDDAANTSGVPTAPSNIVVRSA